MGVGLVIPLFNKKKTLNRAVHSALSQYGEGFDRIVIVDDGSFDEWEGEFEYWGEVDLIRLKNSGPSKARYLGAKYIETEWVSFLDADDWLEENYLGSIKIGIQSGASVVCGGHCEVNQYGALTYVSHRPGVIDDCLEAYADNHKFLNSSTVAVRRDLFLSCAPVGYRVGEDIYLWLQILGGIRGYYCDRILSFIDKTADCRSPSHLMQYPLFMYLNSGSYRYEVLSDDRKICVLRRSLIAVSKSFRLFDLISFVGRFGVHLSGLMDFKTLFLFLFYSCLPGGAYGAFKGLFVFILRIPAASRRLLKKIKPYKSI